MSVTVLVMLSTLPTIATAQKTLAHEFRRHGVGLHSGAQMNVCIKPAPVGHGRWFQRVDLPGQPMIPANLGAVNPTQLSTELVCGEASVRTVEHLLAALTGMGVSDVVIEIDGPEVPLLDGSAKEWVEAIVQAGIISQAPEVEHPPVRATLTQPLTLQEGDAIVSAFPAETTRFTYGIDFSHPAIGNQWYSFDWTPETFAQEVAPARTFGFAEQVEQLRAMGLIKGGSLENALVCGAEGWVNPPLRFANEPARHKLLDLVGDLSLLGHFPKAHFFAYKASHTLHTRFAQQLQDLLASS